MAEKEKKGIGYYLFILGAVACLCIFVVEHSVLQCSNGACVIKESSLWCKNLRTRSVDISEIQEFYVKYVYEWWLGRSMSSSRYYIIAITQDGRQFKFFKNSLESYEKSKEKCEKLNTLLRYGYDDVTIDY